MTVHQLARPRVHDQTVRWVSGLFLMCVLLQRFAIPGTPVALLLPATLLWVGYALSRGIVVIDRTRAALWVGAFGAAALVIPIQGRFVADARMSLPSWGLFLVVWSPFVLRLLDVRTVTYLSVLRRVADIATWLAVASIVMMATQLLGLSYTDWFARAVPDAWELSGFTITYPVEFGSAIYRANAWIGLEPSMVSAQIGLGILAALLTRRSSLRLAVLLLGMACTISGSGFAILTVGIVVLLLHPSRRWLRQYWPIVIVAVGATITSKVGALLLERVTEYQNDQSSTSLRSVAPYRYLWPLWIDNVPGILLGRGPGSSQALVAESNVLGLLVPSPIKVFFDYGLMIGALLAIFLFACYVGGPSRAFAVSLLLSLWLLQPGTTTLLVVAPVLIFVTLWSPRTGSLLESRHAQDLSPSPVGPSEVRVR